MNNSQIFDEINSKLGPGWACSLISTMTPGVVRIQLLQAQLEGQSAEEYDNADMGIRCCFEGPTLEASVEAAGLFTHAHTWEDYLDKQT